MAIFEPKPWVKPFGKMSIFRLFELLFFYSLQKRFFDVEDSKTHFLAYIAKKKKVEKIANLGPKPWVNPLENFNSSTVCTCCFYSVERRFFSSRIS